MVCTKYVLASGYHQLCIQPDDRQKTGCVAPDAFYEWMEILPGLVNAPSAFRGAMHCILGQYKKCELST
jgi:hypothetical protein